MHRFQNVLKCFKLFCYKTFENLVKQCTQTILKFHYIVANASKYEIITMKIIVISIIIIVTKNPIIIICINLNIVCQSHTSPCSCFSYQLQNTNQKMQKY